MAPAGQLSPEPRYCGAAGTEPHATSARHSAAAWALQAPRRRSCRPRLHARLWRLRRSLSRGLARFYKTCFRLAKRRRASECGTSNAAQTVALLIALAHALLPYVVNALLKSLPRQQPPGRLKHSLLSVCSATPGDASRRASKPRRQPTESTACSKCRARRPPPRSSATTRSHGQGQEV